MGRSLNGIPKSGKTRDLDDVICVPRVTSHEKRKPEQIKQTTNNKQQTACHSLSLLHHAHRSSKDQKVANSRSSEGDPLRVWHLPDPKSTNSRHMSQDGHRLWPSTVAMGQCPLSEIRTDIKSNRVASQHSLLSIIVQKQGSHHCRQQVLGLSRRKTRRS